MSPSRPHRPESVHPRFCCPTGLRCPGPCATACRNVSDIDDPTGAGRGKVAAIHTSLLDDSTAIVIDNPSGAQEYFDGLRILEIDYYCYADPDEGARVNEYSLEWGPKVTDYFNHETGEIDLSDGWGMLEGGGGMPPVGERFTAKLVFDNAAGTYDYYVNDVLQGDDVAGFTWVTGYEDNYAQMKFWRDVEVVPETENGMLIDRVHWSYTEIPEPGMLMLGGLGLLALLRRRK